jgi:hypothetical protein
MKTYEYLKMKRQREIIEKVLESEDATFKPKINRKTLSIV